MRSQSSRSRLNISSEYKSTIMSSRVYSLPKQTIDTNISMNVNMSNTNDIKHLFESLRETLEENKNVMKDEIVSNTIDIVNSQNVYYFKSSNLKFIKISLKMITMLNTQDYWKSIGVKKVILLMLSSIIFYFSIIKKKYLCFD
jgi:hypothetical protein